MAISTVEMEEHTIVLHQLTDGVVSGHHATGCTLGWHAQVATCHPNQPVQNPFPVIAQPRVLVLVRDPSVRTGPQHLHGLLTAHISSIASM